MKESTLFFLKFFRGRGKIGSIAPSSRFLVRAMMKMIPFDKVDTLVELGAGTGALTKALVQKIKPGAKLILFEPDEEFAAILSKQFGHLKNVILVKANAAHLLEILNQHNFPKPDCIVSSLPFATFGETASNKILAEIENSLSQDGLFVLYQYTQIIFSLLLKHFKINHFSIVLLNVPPAIVFQCIRLNK